MRPLTPAFFERPLAHRGLHDRRLGRVENSRAAFRAAVELGYGVELDLQLSADGEAVVFHDATLDRMTDETGSIRIRRSSEIKRIHLKDARQPETIPLLAEVLKLIPEELPVLIELKDQTDRLSDGIGGLERSVARTLDLLSRPNVAVMSFNPYALARMATLAPNTPRGLVTEDFDPENWPGIPSATLARLRSIRDFGPTRATFISHKVADLTSPRVAELKAGGANILCWTVRSPTEEAEARKIADNITFEGYHASFPVT